MKFIANKGAPNIPLAIIEAQESETLIFFCGAGISYPAGLPSFSGLVKGVYEGLGEQRKDLEDEAFKNKFYGLLPEHEPGDGASTLEQFLPLANEGNAIAQNILGRIYVTGEDVAQDYAEAVKWFRLAAEQGHRGAMKTLSFLYWGGEGVARDYVEAYMWYSLAATLGNEPTRDARDVIAGAMTPAQIAEAERLAREWLASHGE